MIKQVRMRLTDDDIKVVAILLAKKMKFQLEQARQKLEPVWDAEEKEQRQIIEFRYEPIWVWG
jgi:hypothetical protein